MDYVMADILRDYGIDSFRAIPYSSCRVINERRAATVPELSYVIMMTVPYYTNKDTGNLALFAAVRDYHIFYKNLFSALSDYMNKKYPDNFAVGYADASPIDEVRAAATAGLGIIGRHRLLITDKYSSFVFIGEFITDLTPEELSGEGIDVTAPFDIQSCEDCGICTASCPGGCIDSDKSACVSAISQRKKDPAPEEVATLIKSGYVWGCDICQRVCPHSTGIPATPVGYFTEDVLCGMTEELLHSMTDAEYNTRAFSWRTRSVMERNIKILDGWSDEV